MKVINYVYAIGVYVLINAALYGSEYSKVTGVHGRSFILEETSALSSNRSPSTYRSEYSGFDYGSSGRGGM